MVMGKRTWLVLSSICLVRWRTWNKKKKKILSYWNIQKSPSYTAIFSPILSNLYMFEYVCLIGASYDGYKLCIELQTTNPTIYNSYSSFSNIMILNTKNFEKQKAGCRRHHCHLSFSLGTLHNNTILFSIVQMTIRSENKMRPHENANIPKFNKIRSLVV